MESTYGPSSVDEPSLLYKLQRKIKVFNTRNPLPNRGYNLVAGCSKYGLVFMASPDGLLMVYHLKDLVDTDREPQHTTVQLKEKPTHIAVSGDQELLVVTGGQLITVFRISNFQGPNPSSIDIRTEVGPSTFVSGLQWNPIVADNLAIVFFDGTLLVANILTPQVKKVQTKARCLCWSPKGKQLVTGNNDGTLTQYKPDLTPAKNIPAPNLFEGAPTEALAVYWISTFQFTVVYKNATDNSRPFVTIVNTPKGANPNCLNYEDVCYSMGSNRPWYYYLQGIPQWNIIMASSSNSMEIATLGCHKEGDPWIQWCQSDEARPELPLIDKKLENFPIGISIDTCAIHQLPWGENSVLPFMPLLHVLSNNGLLTIFNVINMKKEAPQICAPPQQLMLPNEAMTSAIPGEPPAAPAAAPTPAPAPTPTKPQMQPVQLAPTPQVPSAAPPPQYGAGLINVPKPPSYTQPQANQAFAQVSAPSQHEQKQAAEIKATAVAHPKPTPAPVAQAPQPVASAAQTAQQAQENAALKAEQEKLNKLKADQELEDMLVKEVNDFQMELYKFMVKTRETQTKLQRDINSINSNFASCALDGEQLRKECSSEELRGAIIQLKLELVRACAAVAEARTHAEAKDQHQWTQADPLTTKRVASVKKLAYYVQNQLEQAQKSLDYKWNDALARDSNLKKPGTQMIRPILDDVYQPLVKQQEILSRQQAVLRTLRNALKECDVTPMFKSTKLLRSTPFKKDPLSKLTKNILNMSIEPEKPKEPLLSSQKLDALRDMLSNHKTVKIKPVNVETREYLATMRLNYEKSLKEKARLAAIESAKKEAQTVAVKHVQPQPAFMPKAEIKVESKHVIHSPALANVPSFTPVGGVKPPTTGLTNVARTLFTDEPKKEPPKPIPQPQPPKQSAFAPQYSPITPVTLVTSSPLAPNTRSVLKDLLNNKQAGLEAKAAEAKNDASTFMGQAICSPSSFAFSSTTTTAAPTTRTTAFTAKPISDISKMFNKFQPQAFAPDSSKPTFGQEPKLFEPKPVFVPESKPQTFVEPKPSSNIKSSETGEPEATEAKTVTLKPKADKMTNLFGMKTSTPLPPSNVPDVLRSTQEVKPDKTPSKPVEKENLPDESKTVQKAAEIKAAPKPLIAQANKSSSIFGAPPQVASSTSVPTESKPDETKSESKVEASKATESSTAAASSASSKFAMGNVTILSVPKPTLSTTTSKPESAPLSPVTVSSPSSPTPSSPSSVFASTSSSAASVFGAAVASQAKTTSQAASIFASAVTSSASGNSSQGSIFASSPTSVFGSPPQASESEPSIFSKPTPASPGTPSSVFGAATTTSQPSWMFGGSAFTSTTTQSTTSVFGSSTTSVFGSTTTQSSVFGSTTTTPSVFSSPATTTQASIFSSVANTSEPSAFTPTTTPASVFGSSTATTQSSMFGTSGGSMFASATSTPSQTSVFGTPAASTQASSVFGAAASTTQSSVFGGTPTSTTQASVFGTPTAATQASVFGGAPSQPSVFGSPPATTAQSGSLFGGAETNLFAAASISTTSAPTQASGGSIFGASSPSSVFGSSNNTNVFGGKSAFGQSNATSSSIFGSGGATTFGQSPQSPPANFWSGGSSTEGGFGASPGGFGQQATTQASSIFGGTTGGSFSTPSPAGQAFSNPQQSAFGSPQQQTAAAPAFGGSPGFGGSAAFGASPAFGSASGGFGSFGGFSKSSGSGFGAPAAFGGGAAFGGTPAFGSTSPGKMFGGSSPPPAFNSAQSNATFESLATQNTLTFGNLAQQSGQPPQQQPTFNTSPSFSGWRG